MIAKWTKVAFISSVAFAVVLAAIVPTAAQGPLVRNIAQPPGSRPIAVRTASAKSGAGTWYAKLSQMKPASSV